MIPHSSISRELASQRQRDRLAQAEQRRQVALIKAEAVTAEPREKPRRRLRRVLRAVVVLGSR